MRSGQNRIKVMFVCLGNICRSPMAEAVFQYMVDQDNLSDQFEVLSSAVGNWHVGDRPHSGTQTVLKKHGIPLNPEKRALLLQAQDLQTFDYVLALDQEIAANVKFMYGIQIARLMEFGTPGLPLDVPDPYYNHKFDIVYELVTDGCRGLLDSIREKERF